jgi:CheY-like chemotaxis protein
MSVERLASTNVRPIQPLRVLLAGRDARFLRVTSFLLERNGFEVESTPQLDGLADLVERHRSNVVVLDSGSARTTAARAAAAIQALHPKVGLLLVSDDPGQGPTGFRALPKWAPIDRLVDEVELSYINLPPRDAAAGRELH